jgi:hypothetical protein
MALHLEKIADKMGSKRGQVKGGSMKRLASGRMLVLSLSLALIGVGFSEKTISSTCQGDASPAAASVWLAKAADLLKSNPDSQAALSLAVTQAKAGLFAAAAEIARKTTDPALRYEAFRTLASCELAAGKKNDADKHIYDAYTAVQDIKPERALVAAGSRVAELQMKIKPEEAEMKFSIPFTIADLMKDKLEQIEAYCSVMECEYRAGKTDDASAVFKALPDLAEKMASAASRNDALKHITLVQLRLGLFDDALATTRKIPDNNARSHVLRDIAQSLAEKGKRDKAKALMPEMAYPLHRWIVQGAIVASLARDGEFKVAIDMAKTMPADEAATSQALMIIATQQAKAHFTDEAIISAERISDGANKCIAFEEIAREQIRIGKKNDAFKSLAQARQAATEIRNADAALHLAEVAALYGKGGDSAKADDTFVKAFQLARKMNGLLLQSDALQKISWGQIRAGDKRAIDTLVESLAFLTKRQEAGTDSAHKRLQTICGFAAVMARDGWPSGVKEALTALRDENPVIRAWFCISVARAFIEKQHPAEKIDWDNL